MSFYDTFESLCKKAGVSPSRAAQDCGIHRSNVTAWKNNGGTPRGDALQKIANYFSVSTDCLLGTAPPSPDILDEVDVAFYGDYQQLTQDDKETLRAMARIMRQRRADRQE